MLFSINQKNIVSLKVFPLSNRLLQNMIVEESVTRKKNKNQTLRYLAGNKPISLLFLGFFISFNVFAGDSLKSVSLDSAISMGLQHSRQIELSSAKLEEDKASLKDLNNRVVPDVDLGLGYQRVSDIPTEYFSIPGIPFEIPSTAFFPVILNNYSATASLSENVFNGFQWKYAVQSMQFEEKSAEFTLDDQKNNVSLTITMEYINLFKLQRAHDAIKENIKQLSAHVDEVTDFNKHGLATQNDLLRAQLQLSNAQLNEIDIKNQIQTQSFNLDIMLGLPEGTGIAIDSNSILNNKSVQPLPFYLGNVQNRNDLKAADMQQKEAASLINETKSGLYPHLTIGADYDYLRPNPRIVPPLDQFQPTWDIGIRLTYSLTSLYDNKSKTDVSRARYAEAQAQYNNLSDNARMSVNRDYLQYTVSLQKIDVAQRTLEQAQENYKIVKSKYDNHIALLTDLLDADTYLLNAKINLISSRADATLAYYSMLKSAGVFTTK